MGLRSIPYLKAIRLVPLAMKSNAASNSIKIRPEKSLDIRRISVTLSTRR